jgi:hypothetical protein
MGRTGNSTLGRWNTSVKMTDIIMEVDEIGIVHLQARGIGYLYSGHVLDIPVQYAG